jgi:CubicO group peptidase (beta-lactamase class C family)
MRAFLLSLCLLFAPPLHAADYVPPPGQWASVAPERAGFDPQRLAAAVALAQRSAVVEPADLERVIVEHYSMREPGYRVLGPTKPRADTSGMVLRGGRVVAQWGDVERTDMVFSVSKSFLATLAGFALADARIGSLDEPVARRVEGPWFDAGPHARITWRHLLEQTSDWRGELHGIEDWADRPVGANLAEWRNPPRPGPGVAHEYNDVRVNLLALALLQVLRQPLAQVLEQRVMAPIGATPMWRWHGYRNGWVGLDGVRMQSVSGGGHFGGGIFMGTADLARFGLLVLRDGRWGERQVLPRGWVATMATPSAPKPDYGLLWWLNTGRKEIPAAPASAIWAAGFGGNWVYVDRDNDLMVVLRWVPQHVPVIDAVLGALRRR